MTGFANYLHSKSFQNRLAEPTRRPQSLDAYLELKHTVEILTQQVQEIEQQKRSWKNKEKNLEDENQLLKEQWEEVKKQWKINKSSFPTTIEPLKQVVMTTHFSKK